MKDNTKKGILAGLVLDNMSEDYFSLVNEMQEETKPSRINNKILKSKKKDKQRKDRDFYD